MTDVADNLWERLCAMPRPHKVVDFPRKDENGQWVGQLAIQVLTQGEQEEAAASADRRARALIIGEKGQMPKDDEAKRGYNDLYTNAAADEILYRACRTLDRKGPFFPSPGHMRKQLSVDEVGLLMSSYYTVQEELGPIASRLTKEETDALIERIRKSGERHFLDFLSPDAARSLAFSLVFRLPSSPTDTSSPGTPPESPISSSSSASEAAGAEG